MSDSKLSNYFHTNNYPPEFIAGVEYEIESLQESTLPSNPFAFVYESDNSLRNGGMEFKTGPLTYQNSIDAFKFLHKNLKYGKAAFSDRTSIHVHVNVGNFSLEEAKKLVLTYALLEPFFFAFVNENRKNSIYCVPLNYTTLPASYYKDFNNLVNTPWHKYTAFNILPVKDFGSVEFRHLEGTNNLEKFTTWLTSLKSLHDKIFLEKFNPFDILSNKRNVIECAREILPELTRPFTDTQMKEMMYDSILDVKLASGGIN